MGSKWTSVSTATYADGTPPDDGSATEANRIKIATIKSDLTDPLDTAIDSIVANLDELHDEATTLIATDYTTVASDHAHILEVTSGKTITLLAASTAGAGYRVGVKNAGTINVAVSRSGSDTIDGATSQTIPPDFQAWYVVNASANGYISDRNTVSEWINSGLTPTFVDADTFTLAGDQTTEFHVGRRLKITDTAGTDYGVITSSAFTTLTTVDVLLDSGSIDSGISAVSYGIASHVNPSVVMAANGTLINLTGRSVTFTGIPAWATQIAVSFSGASTDGATAGNYIAIRLGDSGGVETSGYVGAISNPSGAILINYGSSFQCTATAPAAAHVWHGSVILTLHDPATFLWAAQGQLARSDSTDISNMAGSKALSAALTQVQVLILGSTDSFDAGSVNIRYS